MDKNTEVQPDALLRLPEHAGGGSRIDPDGYVSGTPELVAEVAYPSASYDLHDKRRVYCRNGVNEYIVWRVYGRVLDWFVLEQGEYRILPASADGILRSRVFPDLTLDSAALLSGDAARVLAVLREHLETPEHHAFVKQIQKP